MIESCRHDVANFAPCARCVFQGVQPQLHIHSANIRQIECAPLGDDAICQIVCIRFDGGLGFLVLRQFMATVVGYKLSDRFRHGELGVEGIVKRIFGLLASRRCG
jgi:hypothetical protein